MDKKTEEVERNGRMPVPQFGGWDQKTPRTDYSMVFQRARANRKHRMNEARPSSLGNEQELIAIRRRPDISPPKRKTLLKFFSCGSF